MNQNEYMGKMKTFPPLLQQKRKICMNSKCALSLENLNTKIKTKVTKFEIQLHREQEPALTLEGVRGDWTTGRDGTVGSQSPPVLPPAGFGFVGPFE